MCIDTHTESHTQRRTHKKKRKERKDAQENKSVDAQATPSQSWCR